MFLFEVVFSRILPGVVNIYSIFLISSAVGVSEYGYFSTALATTGLLSNLLYGPIKNSIIPECAEKSKCNGRAIYEGRLLYLSLVFLFFAFSLYLCFVFVLVAQFFIICLVLIVFAGLFDTWQLILRAKIQFYSYGFAALVQSVILLVSLKFYIGVNLSVEDVLLIYIFSYMGGFVVAFFCVGCFKAVRPEWVDLLSSLKLGGNLTLGTLAENSIFLGFRYSLIYFGLDRVLSLFSFAIDLAQRSVGVVINITSFAVVPKAYKALAHDSFDAFKRYLVTGGRFSLLASSVVASLMPFVLKLGSSYGLIDLSLYSVYFFCSAVLAVIVNRMRKLILDPLLVQQGLSRIIPFSYFLFLPVVVFSVWLCFKYLNDFLLLFSYPFVYFLSAVLAYFFYRKSSVAVL